MVRKLASVVKIDDVVPIAGADAIECAQIGGWTVVVKRGEYQVGDLAVYFEIDSFLPEGNPAWQFLVDKAAKRFVDSKGHVLRSIKLRGQVSQGLLLGLSVLHSAGVRAECIRLGDDVSDVLGISKYEPPVPAELSGIARGLFPSQVIKTDQERIQNLGTELFEWSNDPNMTWEVTEKLEGASCTFAWLANDLHVCSRNIDLMEADDNSLWKLAKELSITSKFKDKFNGRNLALQGEIIGFGIQGNIYGLRTQKFYLFDAFDVDQKRYLNPSERRAIASQLSLDQVPVIESSFRLPSNIGRAGIDALIVLSDGDSALKPEQLREGLVFKANERRATFKIVSNKYLLKQTS
jgi:RNA ligase (TIGR02306 family)